ncbi:hypothetical protein NM688_g3320 [Phlebia brevispora]|uniref:Uncharacterized protein n=1 Tax=Phlebia brevispora TaxID=194682 RepID=A0ACC1T652_9APHY|nr:hypothetical protein NM688_g3320 [Phlebia brevispora]
MMTEERTEVVKDYIPEYEEKRASDHTGQHTTAVAQAADMSCTIAKVVIGLQNLHQHTNAEIILICCCSSIDDSSRPFEFHTTDRIVTFVKEITKVGKNYVKQLLDLKKVTALLIMEKLAEISSGKLTKMSYQGFDKITDKFSIVIHNWPFDIFQAPSKYATKNEVQSLYDSWQSGDTWFRTLSTQEYDEWCKTHPGTGKLRAAALKNIGPQAAASNSASNNGQTVDAASQTLGASGTLTEASSAANTTV